MQNSAVKNENVNPYVHPSSVRRIQIPGKYQCLEFFFQYFIF